MSNYITANNQTLNDIFKQQGIINSDSVGNTGIKFTIISSDANPLMVDAQNANNLNMQTAIGSTGTINFLPSSVQTVSVGSTGIWLSPNNENNITMFNTSVECFKQFSYGSLRYTSLTGSSNITLNAYDVRNIFIETSVDGIIVTLNFPPTPPNGLTFRIIKAHVTVTHLMTINLVSSDSSTFITKSNTTFVSKTITSIPTAITVSECTYLSQANKWMCSYYPQ
jgi:hypothetical protein